MNRDISKDSVSAVRHKSTYDSESLNRAMEMAISDENFLDKSINLLKGLIFPASKGDIINHIKKATNDPDVVSLFQNLDGYIQFKDQYHIRKAIEENDPKKKTTNQITNETREIQYILKLAIMQELVALRLLKRLTNQRKEETFLKWILLQGQNLYAKNVASLFMHLTTWLDINDLRKGYNKREKLVKEAE